MDVLIVGAGPTGLTAAVELARRGADVEVIDRRDQASPFSRAVGIMPRSLESFQASGVTDRLVEEGMTFRQVKFYNEADPALALPLTTSAPQHGFDFILGLAQDRTEDILREAFIDLGGVVHYSTELTELEQTGDCVVAKTREGSEVSVDYLIGADGIASTTRQLVNIDFPGHDLPETWSIADVDATGWSNTDAFTICRLPEGEVVVVAPLEPERFRIISNTDDALSDLPLDMNITDIRREGQFQISIRQVKEYSAGRVFLAGDAAHCHSPVGGRGMNLGIADGVELAQRMTDGTLEGYSASRHKDGARTIALSERARKIMTSANPIVRTGVLLGLKAVSAVPKLQQRMANTFLYG